jgi:hypothetical protein
VGAHTPSLPHVCGTLPHVRAHFDKHTAHIYHVSTSESEWHTIGRTTHGCPLRQRPRSVMFAYSMGGALLRFGPWCNECLLHLLQLPECPCFCCQNALSLCNFGFLPVLRFNVPFFRIFLKKNPKIPEKVAFWGRDKRFGVDRGCWGRRGGAHTILRNPFIPKPVSVCAHACVWVCRIPEIQRHNPGTLPGAIRSGQGVMPH